MRLLAKTVRNPRVRLANAAGYPVKPKTLIDLERKQEESWQMSPPPPPKQLLREDTDHRFHNLFLIGPYDYGADQLYVNGYTFTGKPPEYLSEMVSDLYQTLEVVSTIFGLSAPTIYFVSHSNFPRRIAAFIGESSQNPMIALFPARLVNEGFPEAEGPILFVLKILVHELMHAHVELVLGGGLAVEESIILQWEEKFAKAQSKTERIKVLHDFVAKIAEH